MRLKTKLFILFSFLVIAGHAANVDSLLTIYEKAEGLENRYESLKTYIEELENSDRSLVTKYAFELLDIAASLKDAEKQGAASRIIGRNYLFLNNNDSAFIYLVKSNEHFSSLQDSSMVIKNMGNIALVYQRENNYEKAITTYIMVIEFAKRNNLYYSASSQLVNLASIYIDQNNYTTAIECLEEVKTIYEGIPEDHEDKEKVFKLFPAVNINLGICYAETDNFQQSISSYDNVLASTQDLTSKFAKAYYQSYAYKNKGDIYSKIARIQENEFGLFPEQFAQISGSSLDKDPSELWTIAQQNYESALAGFQEIENKRGIIFTKTSLGEALSHLNKNIQAQILLGEALKEAQDQNFKEEIRDAYEFLAYNEYRMGNGQMAFFYRNKYNAFKDSVRNDEREALMAEQAQRYEADKKQLEIEKLEAEQQVQARKQMFFNAIFISAILGILIIGYLLYTRYRYKQQLKITEFEKNLNQAMSRFVPMKFINALGKDKITEVNLGDQIEKEVSVVFTDIRQFTTISEKLTPKENFKLVKDYSERMGPIIMKHNGFINQYMGDGIMAIFDSEPDDALKSCIEMQQEVDLFSMEQTITDKEIRVGMGIHTGDLVLGIIGDENRRDAALISDTVNSAARMESSTKYLGAKIIVSEETVSKLANKGQFDLRYIGEYQAKGKEEPLKLYECYDLDTDKDKKLKKKTTPIFEKGIKAYQKEKFEAALVEFYKVLEIHPEDITAQKYVEMTKEHINEIVKSNIQL